MSDPAAPSPLPPRPNLGPEPFAEPGRWNLRFLAVALTGFAVAAILILWYRRRARMSAIRSRSGSRSASGGPISMQDRLIALSPSIRSALTRRFGPSCLAKTTQELEDDGRIVEALGDADFRCLIDILNEVDRLKFSEPELATDDSDLGHHLATWESSVARLTKALEGTQTRPSRVGP